LSGVAMMGSGAFLLIYAAVNAGHLRILKQTQAKRSIVFISLLLCLLLFFTLEVYSYQHAPMAVYTMIILLIGCFVFEMIYRAQSRAAQIKKKVST
jgi:drug/metabolite transporter (DMT)-like permease